MPWYSASIIVGLRTEENGDAPCLAYENVILIEASSFEEAAKKMSDFGSEESLVDEKLKINDFDAKRVFLGVRKIISVSNPYPFDLDKDRPTSFTELSYSLFRAKKWEDLESMVAGAAVNVDYLE